jgi:prepilin-type processing-associated H-X9-DG protein
MKRLGISIVCLILGVAAVLRAQSPSEAVAPFVDQQVVLVAEVDLEQVDLAGLEQWYIDRLDAVELQEQERQNIIESLRHSLREEAAAHLDGLRAAGVRRVQVVFSLDDLTAGAPVFLVVPVEQERREQAAQSLQQLNMHTRMIRGALVAAEQEQTLDRLERMEPMDRPDIGQAFELTGEAPIRVALSLSPQVRQVFEQMLPNLPQEVGGQPASVLTRGIQQAGLAVKLPPDGRLELRVQSADPQAAEALNRVIGSLFEFVRGQPDAPPELAPLLEALRPEVQDDQLRLEIAGEEVDRLAGAAMPAMMGARDQALRVQSASNIRQLAMGFHMYASDTQGNVPEDLDDIQRYLGDRFEEVMTNPQRPQFGSEGYVYIPPHEGQLARVRPADQRLVIYERFDEWPGGVAAGFADGHVEFVEDRERFEQLLREAKGEADQD